MSKISGNEPVRETEPRSRSARLVEEVSSVGKGQGLRLGLEPMLRVWREVRPEKAAEATAVKLLRLR